MISTFLIYQSAYVSDLYRKTSQNLFDSTSVTSGKCFRAISRIGIMLSMYQGISAKKTVRADNFGFNRTISM